MARLACEDCGPAVLKLHHVHKTYTSHEFPANTTTVSESFLFVLLSSWTRDGFKPGSSQRVLDREESRVSQSNRQPTVENDKVTVK